jgi:hypothetical protein
LPGRAYSGVSCFRFNFLALRGPRGEMALAACDLPAAEKQKFSPIFAPLQQIPCFHNRDSTRA